MNPPRTRLALAALLAGAAGIGFAPVLVRLSEAGPSATAFFRILFALPLLWCWVGFERRRQPATFHPITRTAAVQLVAAGIFFTGDLAVWHWSLQLTSVANSTLLTNIAPVFVTLGSWIFFGERIAGSFILGMAVALGGAVLLVGRSYNLGATHFTGDTLAVLTALFYAAYQLTVKRLRDSCSTATIMAWSGLITCPALWMVGILSGEKILASTTRGWLVLVGLALISHVGGQTLIAYALGHLRASFSSLALLLQPVVAALLAWMVLLEPLSTWQLIGAVIVLSGIILGGWRRT